MTTDTRSILPALTGEQLFWLAINGGQTTRRQVSKVLTSRAIAAKRRPARSQEPHGSGRLRRAA
jgi:hypothetical protein